MVDIYHSRVACNSYLIYKNKNEAILVDPGYNKNNCLIDHIHHLGLRVVAILITHAHYDHIGALKEILKEFPEATTYISELELKALDNPKYNLSFVDDYEGEELTFVPENLKTLWDGEEFMAAGYKIRCILTPFHTFGSACFIINEEDNALFTGDTLFYTTIGRSDLPGSCARETTNSLRKLIELQGDYNVYPGHGIKTTLNRERMHNTYLKIS